MKTAVKSIIQLKRQESDAKFKKIVNPFDKKQRSSKLTSVWDLSLRRMDPSPRKLKKPHVPSTFLQKNYYQSGSVSPVRHEELDKLYLDYGLNPADNQDFTLQKRILKDNCKKIERRNEPLTKKEF